MPKKPPFNHFRKSCRSPSNGNKKEKGITGAVCSLQGMCLPVPQVDVWGRGAGGEFLVALPALLACVGPADPSRPFPEGRHLHVAREQLPQQRVHPGGFPPWPAVPAGATGAAVPTHQRNPLAGHTRSTESHFCIQHRGEPRSCPLGMPSSLRGLWAARQRSHTRAA